jgi:3-mercaptopyruvate sulfurtransferase SseA
MRSIQIADDGAHHCPRDAGRRDGIGFQWRRTSLSVTSQRITLELTQRGWHIPGAANIPWSMAVRQDGTFESADELRSLYQSKGITPEKEVIAYCRIGERSSHTWFVLHYLLGYQHVRNYDDSWTEWGSLIGLAFTRPVTDAIWLCSFYV